jgi:hypothetical protein
MPFWGNEACDFCIQAATDTASIKHEINPMVFSRRIELLDAAGVVQSLQDRHNVLFQPSLEKVRVFIHKYAEPGLV